MSWRSDNEYKKISELLSSDPNNALVVGNDGLVFAPVTLGAGKLVYAASVSQSGTSAPTQVVIYNSLGNFVTPSRTSTGLYRLTGVAGNFPASSKTICVVGSMAGANDKIHVTPNVDTTRIDITTWQLSLITGFTVTDGLLASTRIMVFVFP